MLNQYEERLTPVRSRFSSELQKLYGEARGDTLLLFLINYCSQGVAMTEHVTSWIERSGEACVQKGWEELGKKLIGHAHHEEGHESYMVDDTKALVTFWNQNHSKQLDAVEYLNKPLSPGVIAYQKLHEDYIKSETPYAQIAIEYEIEKVSVDYGPDIMKFCAAELGEDAGEKLSFISHHVILDVAHTKYNRLALDDFLRKNPAALDTLVTAGTQALMAYGQYLADCMSRARYEN